MVEEEDGETTLSPRNSSNEHLNAEQLHKTTSDLYQRTSGIQKSSPLSSKGGRTEYKR